ncbi:MAG TPA: hypothetical protein VG711_04480 [Phycisphaerales bacterium]|nr:hypothetical protein [Phycisphaerales bacterium]
MTSAHSMLLRGAFALLFLIPLCANGCSSEQKLEQPTSLNSPYDHSRLWAVAPFMNESGVSGVDGNHVADLFTEQVQEVNGINCVPVNRVLLAMQQLRMPRIQSPNQAIELMRVLNVDGLIVGTISSYEPYRPQKIGASVLLFVNDVETTQARINPQNLIREASDTVAMTETRMTNPVAQASGVFDASNHATLARLKNYSRGRSEPDSAYGSQIYLVSMEMYTQFVAHELVAELLNSEQIRTAQADDQVPRR